MSVYSRKMTQMSMMESSQPNNIYPQTQQTMIEDMSDEDLVTAVEELKEDMNTLRLDNILIERFLQKNDPKAYAAITRIMDRAQGPKIQFAAIAKPKESVVDFARTFGSKKESTAGASSMDLRLRLSSVGGGPRMTMNEDQSSIRTNASFSRRMGGGTSMGTLHSFRVELRANYSMKNEMLDEDCNGLKKIIQKLQRETKAEVKKLEATIEEMELTNKEVVDTIAAFERYVVVQGVDPITKKIPAEQFIKFIRHWLRQGSALIEKMRLRRATLRQKCFQQKNLLAVKEELSGILRPIDFEQLTIEKSDFIRTIEEKNTHLIGLKRVTGQSSLVLATQKKVLLERTGEILMLKKKILETEENTRKLENEGVSVEKDIEEARLNNERLMGLINTYKAPSVLDYARKKNELNELRKEVKRLQREKYIGTIKLGNMKKKLYLKRKAEKRHF